MSLLTGNFTHPLAERGNDLYQTPPVATAALLRVEPLPHRIWEPAAGHGAIVNVLRAAGHTVYASDLMEYEGCAGRRDFLFEPSAPPGFETIVTNPPFRLAQQFVSHGLTLCSKVVMLLRLAFLESERRRPILDCGRLARVYVFRNRLPMMHRDSWDGTRTPNSGMAFAWFVWDANHKGATELHRISWE